MRRRRAPVLVAIALAGASVGCGSSSRPSELADYDGSRPGTEGAGGRDGGPDERTCPEASPPPSPDARGLCGNTFLEVTSDPPNLYFVIDRSGSMGEIVEGREKYGAVVSAAAGLVRSLGSRVNIGAALFPGRGADDAHACAPGSEVLPTRPGTLSAACGADGPATTAFAASIALAPAGATPTAAALGALVPTLSALPGRTVVLLATDGGPNCNDAITCDEASCIPNIEGFPGCGPGVNCCTPDRYGPGNCLDASATRAVVASLLTKGIKTYVIGVPGSAPYGSLLDQLAIAGGTARSGMSGSTLYYDISHIADLDDALAAIGATVTSSCHLHLATPPPAAGLVNVYLDGVLIRYGSDGWLWRSPDGRRDGGGEASPDGAADGGGEATDDAQDGSVGPEAAGPTEIELVGRACDMLESGRYRRLQIVFGCPTDVPR